MDAASAEKKKRLLILSFTSPLSDPRVFREIQALSQDFNVTVAGTPPGPEGIEFIPIVKVEARPARKAFWGLSLLCGNSRPFISRYSLPGLEALAGRFDLVLVNDADPLPLAFEIAKGAPVFFDAHEYYPKEFEDSFCWNLLFSRHRKRLCSNFIPRCAGMSTVSEGIAKAYAENFNCSPTLVSNAPPFQDLKPAETIEGKIRLIHHGAAIPERRLELMIEMTDYLDERFSLDMMLVGKPAHLSRLRDLAKGNTRVNFVEPAPMQEIPARINRYDIGVFLLPPVSFNYANALPNKFFEFIQARLGIAIGPTPEMAALTKRHELGVVAEDFSPRTLAKTLNALTRKDVDKFKENAAKAASIYNAEAEGVKLLAAIHAALEKPKPSGRS